MIFMTTIMSFFEDNSERMIFFNRGIMETVKKFGWAPDFIICNGWMTSLVPMYARTVYANDPIFSESKIFFNVFEKGFEGTLEDAFVTKALLDKSIATKKAELFAEKDHTALCKGGINYSDAVILSTHSIEGDLNEFIISGKKPLFNMDMNDEKSLNLYQFINDQKPQPKGA